mmetsp:Transcript_16047/g.23727  ORF Transcript_16047/g.23727 Transcript_16047/m.23727 type:complete len:91 (-) Transcript_16047:36-308(-)
MCLPTIARTSHALHHVGYAEVLHKVIAVLSIHCFLRVSCDCWKSQEKREEGSKRIGTSNKRMATSAAIKRRFGLDGEEQDPSSYTSMRYC